MSPQKVPKLIWSAVAIFVLVVFWAAMLGSLRNTTQTFDEGVHAAAGYAYWQYNDYRFNPENGNLAQRVIGLPLWLAHYRFPSVDDGLWRISQEWDFAWKWFYELDNDADAMNRSGRASAGLLAAVLGFLVWRWSRQLFGELGGILSLILYVFNPSILANGALMTSDTAAALFFLLATWAWWRVLQRPAIGRLVASGLAVGGLFVSKMSAPLIVPIALGLAAIRLLDPAPLSLPGFKVRELRSTGAKLLALIVATAIHVIIVLAVIWGFYGFRYSAFSPKLPQGTWTGETWETVLGTPSPRVLLDHLDLSAAQQEQVKQIFARDKAEETAWPPTSVTAIADLKQDVLTKEQTSQLEGLLARPSSDSAVRVLETLRRYRLLPEAYIYGFAHVRYGSLERATFLNGQFSLSGWWYFFPYTFLVKTPVTLFLVIVLAAAAAIHRLTQGGKPARRQCLATFYQTSPLFMLFGVYWIAAMCSHLNIGHRHILPTYPPLFVLCGAAALWFEVPRREEKSHPTQRMPRVARSAVCIAVFLLAAEVCYRFPHYLAYFNGIVRPACAYRHLVYSSLDWGQDLPQVRAYIETRRPASPVYLSYFGFASPVYYRVPAVYAYSVPGRYRSPPIQTFVLSTDNADAVLYDFLRSHSEYDDRVVGRARQGDQTLAVLVKKAAALRLTSGTYLVSASLLQPITRPQRGAFGHWNQRLEKQYQLAVQLAKPILSDDPAERSAALAQMSPENWTEAIDTFEYLRFHRLAAFLRHRKPDDNIGYSILVYHLDQSDLVQALEGPPPELAEDILGERFGVSH